jgi:hypothetical protein
MFKFNQISNSKNDLILHAFWVRNSGDLLWIWKRIKRIRIMSARAHTEAHVHTTHTHTHAHTQRHLHIGPCAHTHTGTYAHHTHIQTHKDIFTQAHVHTHTYTHTQGRMRCTALMISVYSCDVSATPWTSWFLPTPATRGTSWLCF